MSSLEYLLLNDKMISYIYVLNMHNFHLTFSLKIVSEITSYTIKVTLKCDTEYRIILYFINVL